MARRKARLARRRRRLLRLARTVAVTAVLVTGVVWWSGDDDPAGADAKAAAGAAVLPGATTGRGAGPGAGPDAPTAPGAGREDAPRSRTAVSGGGASAARDGAAAGRPGAAAPAPLGRSRPTALAVPAITIEAPVLDLGLDAQGRLGVPPVDDPRRVGWYARGPAPGERGTAVMVGHRDTRTGPAIFLDLDSLGPGNTVRVARADGRVAVFTVDRVRTYAKSDFPDKEVYGSTGRPELRLLTCGGAYDEGTGYEANIVVFAHLTGIDKAI
ncbi:class F sortase [Streptomyces filamentosus]|uniref:class F sortase n=1 Tax=Streptomyces filamentosus TaxID=67294 RepID=UPI0036E14D48